MQAENRKIFGEGLRKEGQMCLLQSVPTLGEIILAFRDREEVSQSDFAKVAEVDAQTISNIEVGRTKRLSKKNLRGVAKAMGLTPEELKAQLAVRRVALDEEASAMVIEAAAKAGKEPAQFASEKIRWILRGRTAKSDGQHPPATDTAATISKR